jgi:hypothetical protein
MVLDSKKDLFVYINGLLSQISKKTNVPNEELLDIFVEYQRKSEKKENKSVIKEKKENVYLEYIVINKVEYLVDSIQNKVYSFGKVRKYIGVYNNENDTIDFDF